MSRLEHIVLYLRRYLKGVDCLKRKYHELSKIKHILYQQRNALNGKKEIVVMQLNPEQLEYVRQFCVAEPYLYKIWKSFRPGFSAKNAPSVIKRVFYKKGNPVFMELDQKEVETCKRFGLRPVPHKYKIYLNTLK